MEYTTTVEFVKKYIEDIVAFFDVNLMVEVWVEDDILMVAIPSSERNSLLIGRNAENLRSLQYVVSAVLRNKNLPITRVNIDIAEYKKQHAEKIAEKARGWFEEVRRTGHTRSLDLNAADRWVVHHIAHDYDDIETYSEGEGRSRQLKIRLKTS